MGRRTRDNFYLHSVKLLNEALNQRTVILPNFIDPASLSGNIPGRGRKPSVLAQKCAKLLKGCPVGMALFLDKVPEFKGITIAERGKLRSTITTGASLAGWEKASVQWTDSNFPLVTRVA